MTPEARRCLALPAPSGHEGDYIYNAIIIIAIITRVYCQVNIIVRIIVAFVSNHIVLVWNENGRIGPAATGAILIFFLSKLKVIKNKTTTTKMVRMAQFVQNLWFWKFDKKDLANLFNYQISSLNLDCLEENADSTREHTWEQYGAV